MRPIVTAARAVFGGYLAAHGAQKLVGAFNGPGLDAAGEGFAGLGLTPGRQQAKAAGLTEVGGGVLTAAGVAHPLGPLMLGGSMAVASAAHREGGPFAANGGYELPVINLALAATLASVGKAGYHLGPSLPRRMSAVASIGGAAIAAGLIVQMVTAGRNSGAEVEAESETNSAAGGTEADGTEVDGPVGEAAAS